MNLFDRARDHIPDQDVTEPVRVSCSICMVDLLPSEFDDGELDKLLPWCRSCSMYERKDDE